MSISVYNWIKYIQLTTFGCLDSNIRQESSLQSLGKRYIATSWWHVRFKITDNQPGSSTNTNVDQVKNKLINK